MKMVDITYKPIVVKTNGKNPFKIEGITFYPDTLIPYKNGYILPILKQDNLGNIFTDITSAISDAGKWVTGATSDLSIDIATDVTGLIKSYNELTGSNVSVNNLTSAQQYQLQSIINTKTNTTGQYTNAQLNEIQNILSGGNDINKYLPYIIGGGLFLILLVLILKR